MSYTSFTTRYVIKVIPNVWEYFGGYGIMPEDDFSAFLLKREDGSFASVYHLTSATQYFTLSAVMDDMTKAKKSFRTGGGSTHYTMEIIKFELPFKIHHF